VVILGLVQSFAVLSESRIPSSRWGQPPASTREAMGSFSLASSSAVAGLPVLALKMLHEPAVMALSPASASSPDDPHPTPTEMPAMTPTATSACLTMLMRSQRAAGMPGWDVLKRQALRGKKGLLGIREPGSSYLQPP